MASYKPLNGDTSLRTGDTADTTVDDATANASSRVMKLIHTYNAGAGQAGIGTEVDHQAEDATNGTVVTAAATRAVLTTVTAGAEEGAFRVGVVHSGSVPAEGSEQMRLSGAGALVVTGSIAVPTATVSGLTAGRVPFASTGGLLTDDADLTFVTGGVNGPSAGLYCHALTGGTTSGGNLGFETTTHNTKGVVFIADTGKFQFDETSAKLTLGTAAVTNVGKLGVALVAPEATTITAANTAISAVVGTNQYGLVVRDATNHLEFGVGSDATNILLRSPTSSPIGLQVGTTTMLKTTTIGTTLLAALALPLVTKTSAYPLTSSDYTCLADATSAAVTITLPNATTCSGRVYIVKRINVPGNNVTVASAGGTIDGATTVVLSAQWQSITVQSDGTNWFIC